MKCYNSFGEMFNANGGGDRSVFNGIAQAKITIEDNYGNESDPVYFRLSTRDPSRPISMAWSKDGKKYSPLNSSAPKDVLDASMKSDLPKVSSTFIKQYSNRKSRNPSYDWTAISDADFIKSLNDYCTKKGLQLHWTDKDTDTLTKKEKDKADKKDINVIKATGIFSQGGKYSFVKYGLEHGEPFAQCYDENGVETGRMSPEKVVGKSYVSDTLASPETFAKAPNDRVANLIEYIYLNKYHLKVSDVLWRGGDVDFTSLTHEFEATISTRENKKRLDEELVETRLKEAKEKDRENSLFGKVKKKVKSWF